MQNNDQKNWRVDRHIPVAVIVMLFLQTAGAIWWASNVQSIIDNNAVRIAKLESRDAESRVFTERLVRVEVKQESTISLLQRLIDKLDSR